MLTEQLLRDVFALDARVIRDPVAGTPLVVPIGSRHRAPEPTQGGHSSVLGNPGVPRLIRAGRKPA